MKRALILGLLVCSLSGVTVQRAPAAQISGTTCQLSTPTDLSTISGTVQVVFWAYNPSGGFTKYELYIDGVLAQTLTVSKRMKNGATFLWNTKNYSNGTHTYTVWAYASGSCGKALPFTVYVSN